METIVQHGGALDRAIAQYGGKRGDWIDLSTGINPNPYLAQDFPADVWHRLPDEGLLNDCLAAARAYYELPDHACLVAAPGTQALIQLLPQIIQAQTVSIVSPTYNEHARCWGRGGAEIHPVNSLQEARGDVVVIVNPNNPTGSKHCANALVDVASRLAKRNGTLIVDEAFCDVDPHCSLAPKLPDNTIVLKSFGKFFGLAGLRLGFAVCHPEMANKIEQQLGPWAVSGPALYVGALAMRDTVWINRTRAELKIKRNTLEQLLARFGFEFVGATDLFITASHFDSAHIVKSLAQNNILVRAFDYEPAWIRFGLPRCDAEFQRLEQALAHGKSTR
ncbi:MAG: threonine-phosphate decarboxylase CobD [Ahrensia sp.]|nr:threonine-phosphate decarboxylase CobD [Ahrensia sp.]